MQSGWREAVSNLATFTVLFPSRLCWSGRCEKIYTIWKKQQQRLIPWCSVMQAGNPSGGARQQYGLQLAQDILLTALCLAYHNRRSGRFPNNSRGREDGRESRRKGKKGLHCNVFSWLPNEPFYRLWHKERSTVEHTHTHTCLGLEWKSATAKGKSICNIKSLRGDGQHQQLNCHPAAQFLMRISCLSELILQKYNLL